MRIKAGELRHRVELLQKTEVTGTYGKETAWQSIAIIRAKVTQPRTDEQDSDHGTTKKQKIVLFVRYTTLINEQQRLRYQNNEYNITSCRDVKGQKHVLVIDAEKRS